MIAMDQSRLLSAVSRHAFVLHVVGVVQHLEKRVSLVAGNTSH